MIQSGDLVMKKIELTFMMLRGIQDASNIPSDNIREVDAEGVSCTSRNFWAMGRAITKITKHHPSLGFALLDPVRTSIKFVLVVASTTLFANLSFKWRFNSDVGV